MKIPVSGNTPELPPSQADEINDRLDLLSNEIQQIEAVLELYKLEFQTVDLEAGTVIATDITASNALITNIDTGTINTTDLFKKRSRFVEGTGEKLICNIKKNNKAIIYCVNSTQSFSIDFINDSGFILSSIPDTIKNIKLYQNDEYICLYVDKTTDDLLYFFTDAEQTAINYDEQQRSLLLDIELEDGVGFFGKNSIEVVRSQELYSNVIETPLLIKNKEDGTNSFTHNSPATGERAFLITQVMNGRTEFYIKHEGNKIATIFVDVLDNGEPERLVIVSVAQTDLNIIKVFLLDGIIAIETTYDVLVDVSYFVSADTNTLTPFSFVGTVGVVPNIYNVDIVSNRRVIIMGDGTVGTGLTIKGELQASIIQIPEGISLDNLTIRDLMITNTATFMGVNLATVNDVSNLGDTLTEEIDNVQETLTTNLDNHIANTNAHGSTNLSTPNRLIIRNASGQADITDPIDTNDEGIVNVGYAKEKAIEGYGQKTDCILKAGLNIDLEWTDTMLTLKTGSELIFPNGTIFSTTKDLSDTETIDGVYLAIWLDQNSIRLVPTTGLKSEDRDPVTGDTGFWWYNYTTMVFWSSNGVEWVQRDRPIPFAQVTIGNNIIINVQKLDYFSYFGGVTWVLPNSNLLLSNGRNNDGTFSTINLKIPNLIQRSIQFLITDSSYFITLLNGEATLVSNNYIYDVTNNYYYSGSITPVNKRITVKIGAQTANGSVITSMNLKRPILIADIQDDITSQTSTWSSEKIKAYIDSVLGGA